jgi:hypothetical protein
MSGSSVFWITMGTGTGAVMGMIYDNLPAGLCFGGAMGIICNLLSWLSMRHSNNK